MENKVAKEVAEQEFERFCEAMDIFYEGARDEAEMLLDKRQAARIIGAIERGALVINEKGEAEYTPVNPDSKHKDTMVFHERSGVTAQEAASQNNKAVMTHAAIAEMCRIPRKNVSGLVGIDIKVCEALVSILMD